MKQNKVRQILNDVIVEGRQKYNFFSELVTLKRFYAYNLALFQDVHDGSQDRFHFTQKNSKTGAIFGHGVKYSDGFQSYLKKTSVILLRLFPAILNFSSLLEHIVNKIFLQSVNNLVGILYTFLIGAFQVKSARLLQWLVVFFRI